MSSSNIYRHYLLTLFLLFTTQIFQISLSQEEFCNQSDKKILLKIKQKLGNPSSLSSWDPKIDCINWNNIRVNINGRVNTVGISEASDIHAPFPPFLDNLPFLTSLTLDNIPNLSGPIPSYLGKLVNLEYLTISGTKITGPIPDFLGRLTNLTQLVLSSNQFNGPIPNFIGQLKRLSTLNLASNKLTGPVPTILTRLTQLSILQLNSNRLSGPIPGFLFKLKTVNYIDLSDNSLVGPLPEYLGHMPNLTGLKLSNNLLTGPIPKSLGRSNLGSIELGHNKLTGDASFLFDKDNKNVFLINIDDNNFKFDFSNVDLSPGLRALNVSHNMIYGSLPKRLGQLILEFVDVSYNQFCGPIPNGRRFKKIDPAIFGHNKCLCGGPLPACK